MRLNTSVVLLVTLLAVTDDIASPQQPQKVHRIGWIALEWLQATAGLHDRAPRTRLH